jgi:hypothetical protein
MLNFVKFYSPNISRLDNPEIWQSFGMPPKVANLIVELIHKGHTTLDYFEKHLMRQNLHPSTARATETTLASLKATNFFGSSKSIPLEKEWAERSPQ